MAGFTMKLQDKFGERKVLEVTRLPKRKNYCIIVSDKGGHEAVVGSIGYLYVRDFENAITELTRCVVKEV